MVWVWLRNKLFSKIGSWRVRRRVRSHNRLSLSLDKVGPTTYVAPCHLGPKSKHLSLLLMYSSRLKSKPFILGWTSAFPFFVFFFLSIWITKLSIDAINMIDELGLDDHNQRRTKVMYEVLYVWRIFIYSALCSTHFYRKPLDDTRASWLIHSLIKTWLIS